MNSNDEIFDFKRATKNRSGPKINLSDNYSGNKSIDSLEIDLEFNQTNSILNIAGDDYPSQDLSDARKQIISNGNGISPPIAADKNENIESRPKSSINDSSLKSEILDLDRDNKTEKSRKNSCFGFVKCEKKSKNNKIPKSNNTSFATAVNTKRSNSNWSLKSLKLNDSLNKFRKKKHSENKLERIPSLKSGRKWKNCECIMF